MTNDLYKDLVDLISRIEEKINTLANEVIDKLKEALDEIIKALKNKMMSISDRYDFQGERLTEEDMDQIESYRQFLEEEKVEVKEDGKNTVKTLIGLAVLFYFCRFSKRSEEIIEIHLERAIDISIKDGSKIKPILHIRGIKAPKRPKKGVKPQVLIEDNWSGVNFREILDELSRTVIYNTRRDLIRWVIAGMDSNQIKKILEKQRKALESSIKRITKTESTSVLARSIKDILVNQYGADGYEYVSEDDSKTCSICKKHHGKVNDIIPPVHPNCRCYIIPHFIVS